MFLSVGIALIAGIQAWLKPVNQSPWDRSWMLIYVGIFAAIGLISFLQRGRWLIVLACSAIAGFILISILRAGTGPAFFMLGWILVVSYGIGDRTFDMLALQSNPFALERYILSIALGLGVLALLVLGLGTLGILYPWAGIGLLAFLTLWILPNLVRCLRRLTESAVWFKSDWRSKDLQFPAIVLSSLAVCFWGGLMWALAPSIHFDTLVYHLGVPAIYVQQHGIVEVSEEFRSYWAHNAEMLYTLGLLLVGQPLPGLVHLVFGLLTTGFTFALGQRIGGTRVGLVAALLFYSIPVVTWESGVVYIDLVVTLYSFAAFYAAMVWWLEKKDRWLVITGIMAGLAMGSKLDAILVLLPLAVFIFLGLVYRYRVSGRLLIGLIAAGIPGLLVFSPWLLRDWWWTGNPIFPFYNAVFASPKWNQDNTFFNFGMFGMGHGVIDFVRLPFDLEISSGAFLEAVPAGMVGAVTLLALPWTYLGSPSRSRSTAALISLVVFSATVLWFATGQYIRYLLPVFPCLAILAALNLEALWESVSASPWPRKMAALGSILALVYLVSTRIVTTAAEWQIPERFPYAIALGLETSDSFLSRSVPVYSALQFLDRIGNGDHKVLSAGNDFRVYTNSRIWSVSNSKEANLAASAFPPGSRLADYLVRNGYSFVLVNQTAIRANPQNYQMPALDATFLQEFARLEFSRRNVYVYRLLPNAGNSAPPLDNLLWNGGFEDSSSGTLAGWLVFGAPVIDRTGTRTHTGQVAVMANASSGFYQLIRIKPDELYTLGHWARADKPQQSERLQINWLDASSKIVDVSLEVVPAELDWQWHQMSVTSPQDAVTALVYVNVHEKSEVWFDDIELVQGKTLDKH